MPEKIQRKNRGAQKPLRGTRKTLEAGNRLTRAAFRKVSPGVVLVKKNTDCVGWEKKNNASQTAREQVYTALAERDMKDKEWVKKGTLLPKEEVKRGKDRGLSAKKTWPVIQERKEKSGLRTRAFEASDRTSSSVEARGGRIGRAKGFGGVGRVELYPAKAPGKIRRRKIWPEWTGRILYLPEDETENALVKGETK